MNKEQNNSSKLGAFIVPTGIGASIGGFAGDASVWARKFAEVAQLIVNPNVVNAGCFSGITPNMLYVEGYSLDEFFKGNLGLTPTKNNKIGVVFDKSISAEVLNIHINTINAVKTVYGIDVIHETTEEEVGVEFFIDESGISMGKVKNIQTLLPTAENLLKNGAQAIAIVCKFKDENSSEDQDEAYESGVGVDPIGGVEAIISHYLSRELKVPCAHSPAFEDYSISTKIVNPKASAEYITPTFLPCILIGLAQAPQLNTPLTPTLSRKGRGRTLTISNLDFLIMPHDALGSTPVFEALKRGITVYAVKENSSVLDVSQSALKLDGVTEVETYEECLSLIKAR